MKKNLLALALVGLSLALALSLQADRLASQELAPFRMLELIAGDTLGCVIAVIGAASFMASLFFPPAGGLALAIWVFGAIVGPTVVGYGVGTECGG